MMQTFYHLLLAFQFLASIAYATPASPLHDLIGASPVPFLDNAVALSEFDLPTPTPDEPINSKRALKLSYVKYAITMDGRGQGNFQNFLVSGSMLVTTGIVSPGTTNGANPYEVVILIGAPAANPVAGSIRYCSNRALYGLIGGTSAASLLEFAGVRASGSTVAVAVGSTLAATNQRSNFNARTGLTANVFLIVGGGFSFTVAKNGAVSGKVGLTGRGYIFPGTAPYKAVIRGKVVGHGILTL